MNIQVLKSKLKQLVVTESSKEYEGSIILDPALIEAANLVPYERVEVNGVDKKERHVTYVVPGKAGDCIIAGGLAQYFVAGDKIHVNCFGFIDEFHKRRDDIRQTNKRSEAVQVVYTDADNKITNIAAL